MKKKKNMTKKKNMAIKDAAIAIGIFVIFMVVMFPSAIRESMNYYFGL